MVIVWVSKHCAFFPYSRSADARYLAVSSQDGYCTLLEFEKDELGVMVPLSGLLLFPFSFVYGYDFVFMESWQRPSGG